MATVRGDIRLNDFMTRSLRSITQAVNMTVSELDSMSRRVGKEVDVSGLNRIRETVSTVDVELEKAVKEQEKLNREVKLATSNYGNLGSVIRTVVGALGVKKIVGLSDQNTQISARLKIMTGGTEEQIRALQNQIFASAQRSRADYFGTADIVSKLGLRAGSAFNNDTRQIIQFSENLNKMFVIAGASQEEMHSASLQLTQALGAGVLRGEELNAIFEAAPNIIQTIAEHLGVPLGQIRELASEGKITADIVRNALLGATRDIERDFNSMPLTWGQVWTMTVNKIIKISQPLLDFISLLAQNWETLEPIVLGVATALGTYVAIQTAYNIVTGIGAGISAISAASAALHAGCSIGEAAAVKTATGAQVGLNAALLACPFTWIVIGLVTLVAVLVYLWNTNDKVAKGMIFAWDAWVVGVRRAVLLGYQILYGLADIVSNIWVGILEGLDNVINGAVGLLNKFFDLIGVDEITWKSTIAVDTATELAAEKAIRDKKLQEEEENLNILVEELNRTRDDRVENREKFELPTDIDDILKNFDMGNIDNVANVENVEGEVDVASEDLKLIRELAEQQYIQNYISNAPVQYITTGDIHENADIDYLIEGVASKVREEIDSSMEGVPVG